MNNIKNLIFTTGVFNKELLLLLSEEFMGVTETACGKQTVSAFIMTHDSSAANIMKSDEGRHFKDANTEQKISRECVSAIARVICLMQSIWMLL